MPKTVLSRNAICLLGGVVASIGYAGIAIAQTANDVTTDAQPVLPSHDHWAAILLAVILLALFLPAAILGPFLHRRDAAELPELHAAQESDSHTATQHEPGHDAAK